MKSEIFIYQIFYDDATEKLLDPGFIPLDNRHNVRPDWYEYWPIRSALLSGGFPENALIGFFSPKFKQKTGLTSNEVIRFMREGEADLYNFSPYFDQSAFFYNVIDQAVANHGQVNEVFHSAIDLMRLNQPESVLVHDSRTVIFSNFFVAKYPVWEQWLSACERLFYEAEYGSSELSHLLIRSVRHATYDAPLKVFIIERVISFLLDLNRRFKVGRYPPLDLPMSGSRVSKFPKDLLILDALKIAFLETRQRDYLKTYDLYKQGLIKRVAQC